MNDPFRYNNVKNQCNTADKKVKYANEKLTDKDETTTGRIVVAGVLSAIARVLANIADDFGRNIVVCIVGAADESNARKEAAFDICQSLLAVSEAQVSAALVSLPAFKLPTGGSTGGAMGLSFASDKDEHLKPARKTIVRDADVLRAFVEQVPPFAVETSEERFLSALLSSDLTAENNIDRAVEAAFETTEK